MLIVFLPKVIYDKNMLQIGSLKLKNWLILAPMAGITDLPFRLIVKRLGPGLVTTEMINAMGMTLGKKKTLRYLTSHPDERPLAVQIFGSRPEVMAEAADIAIEKGADIIDINMGCPARKIVKTGAGGDLLRSPERAKKIISAVRRVCSVPLTVKIREGWSPDQQVACKMAKMIEGCGADAVTIHPRFVSQGFSGQADWSIIADVKKHIKIPVIGNGDAFKPSLALEMKKQTGCNGVMIGRGAHGNPWIFKQILELERGLSPSRPKLQERRNLIIEHFSLLSLSIGETIAAKKMRGLLIGYTKGLPGSRDFRGAFTKIQDYITFVSTLNHYFSFLEDKKA